MIFLIIFKRKNNVYLNFKNKLFTKLKVEKDGFY